MISTMTNTNSPEPSAEIRLLRLEFSNVKRELADVKADRDGLRSEADELRHQLQVLRRSTSWRLTAPLRAFRRRMFRRGEF